MAANIRLQYFHPPLLISPVLVTLKLLRCLIHLISLSDESIHHAALELP